MRSPNTRSHASAGTLIPRNLPLASGIDNRPYLASPHLVTLALDLIGELQRQRAQPLNLGAEVVQVAVDGPDAHSKHPSKSSLPRYSCHSHACAV
jgi:hypothetical protein